MAKWRADSRGPKVSGPAELPVLRSVPTVAVTSHPGRVEAALVEDLSKLVGEPPWKATLSAIAVFNARLLDQLPELERLDLVSPVQLRTLEVLNRLRAVSEGTSPADAVDRFLVDLSDAV
jgi:hypothetical protein